MDNPTTIEQELDRKLPSRGQSLFSSIAGGAGNGAMVGGVPYVVSELYNKFNGKEINKPTLAITTGLVALGAVVGAYFGLREGKQIEEYRNSLNDRIDAMHSELKGNRDKIAELTRKVQEKEQGHTRSA